ncbi:MAG: DegT/DnrJ/EryC1/StrS family aminotransferase [Patescibacteria group bacterium]
MKIPFVNFGKQYQEHKKEYDWAIRRCLSGGRLILQKELQQFEERLAEKLGFKYAVGVGSGTDALILALKAKEASGVIDTTGYTFKATMEAIHHNQCKVLIEDIDEHRLAENVVLPVHVEGMVCKSDKAIIEDAAQAIAAKGVGYSGTVCYSFYPAKVLGGFSDGGAVCTNDQDVYKKVKLYRHHWQTGKNEKYGYTSRLDNVQAAFLSVKLKYLDNILERRAEIAEMYKKLGGLVGLPFYQKGRVWQDFVIRVQNPKKLAEYLAYNGIQTLGTGMTPPHKALFKNYKLPETEKLYSEMLRLPCNETLKNSDIEYIIKKIQKFYE